MSLRLAWDRLEVSKHGALHPNAVFVLSAADLVNTRYAYTQSVPAPHPPPLPSLIPLAHRPVLPFLSHPAALLRERVEKLRETDEFIFTLTFVPDGQGDRGTACKTNEEWHAEDWHVRDNGRVLVRGAAAWSWRCKYVVNRSQRELSSLIYRMQQYSDSPLTVAPSHA